MAFFEPEDIRERRFQDACEKMTMDDLRAITEGEQPPLLQKKAGERLEELESIERYKAEQKQKEEERRAKRKNSFGHSRQRRGRRQAAQKPPARILMNFL